MMSAKIVFSLSVSPFPSMHCKTQCMQQWWSFFLESVMKTPLFFQALFLLHCYTHFTVKVVVELSKVGLREIKVRRNSYVCDYSCGLLGPASLYAQGHWSQPQLLLHCNLTYTTDFFWLSKQYVIIVSDWISIFNFVQVRVFPVNHDDDGEVSSC